MRKIMKIKKMILYLFVLALVGCSSGNASKSVPTSTPILAPSFSSATPIRSTIPVSAPSYKVIDQSNVSQLILLHEWAVEHISYPANTLWFSDSRQFILPVRESTRSGIQSYEIEGFAPGWFTPVDYSENTIDETDQVIIYLAGLHIFSKLGEEIKIPEAKNYCGETIASQIVTIPGTNFVVTGHQHYGDITSSYGTSRLLVWDKNQNSCSEFLKEFVGRVTSLSASQDGHYISYSVITSRTAADGELVADVSTYIYDVSLQKEICHVSGFDGRFNNQNLLAVYDPKEGILSLVTPATCASQKKFYVGRDLSAFAFNPGGDLFAGILDLGGISSVNMLEVWSSNMGEKLHEIIIQGHASLPLINFSPDGRFLITTKDKTSPTEKSKVMLWGIPQE